MSVKTTSNHSRDKSLISKSYTHIQFPDQKKKINIKELTSKITPENMHKEFGWGEPIGLEVW